MNIGLIIGYSVALGVLLVLSFLFSSSDMAYGSISEVRLEEAIKKKPQSKPLNAAKRLSDNYPRTISTILLLNDTVNAGLDSVSTLLGVSLSILVLGGETAEAETWGFIASMICLVVKITFGEIIAKSFGKIFNLKLVALYSLPLRFFSWLLMPITFVVGGIGEVCAKPLLKRVEDLTISEDDLHEMVDGIEEQGMVDPDKAELLHETIRYTHTLAYEVMTPRVDVFAIDSDDDLTKISDDPRVYHYSRVPVYQETIDNIIGFIKTRNLMLYKMSGETPKLSDLLEEPLRFPRSAEINDILKIFKKKKRHFAIVMDEYGGVEGVITMEDILEEIVGEIWDEKDDPEIPYLKRKDGSYIVDGSLTLEDFCDLLGLDFDKTDTEYVTIGGFLVELLDDKFAKVGDVVSYKGYRIKVLAVDKNGAAKKILVTPEEKKEDEE